MFVYISIRNYPNQHYAFSGYDGFFQDLKGYRKTHKSFIQK